MPHSYGLVCQACGQITVSESTYGKLSNYVQEYALQFQQHLQTSLQNGKKKENVQKASRITAVASGSETVAMPVTVVKLKKPVEGWSNKEPGLSAVSQVLFVGWIIYMDEWLLTTGSSHSP